MELSSFRYKDRINTNREMKSSKRFKMFVWIMIIKMIKLR